MRTRTSILLTASLVILLLAGGCKKSSFTGTGREIHFRASSQAPLTKTEYDGTITTSGDKKHERINWVAGDMIAIMMEVEDEETPQFGEYRVSNVTAYSDEVSRCDLNPVGGRYGGNALQWGPQGKKHDFTAVYPSPSVSSSTEDPRWLNQFNEEHIIFCWPSVQTPTPKGESGADALTLLPDMKYAYMYASADEVPAPSSRSEKFNLSFSPLFTSFEIHVSAGDNDEVNLTGFRLIAGEEEVLACESRDFTEIDGIAPGVLTSDGITGGTNVISVQWTGDNKIKLTRDGNPLVFTVFAMAPLPYIDYMPGENEENVDFHQLTIEFTGDEILTRTLDLKQNGEWMSFKPGCKHRILGLNFPALDEGNSGGQGINWNGTVGEDLNWNGAEGEDINWGGNKPYVLPGKFSVSATEQVQFARGNLVYKAGEWDFHKEQYDRCLKDNATVLDFSKTGTFDLFGWATAGIAGADRTMVNYQPWSSDSAIITGQESTNAFGYGPSLDNLGVAESWGDAYAEYCEWGNNYNLQTKLGSGWFTPGSIQWDYIFSQRSASTVNGVENACFTCATVHSLPGLIIFPDDFGTVYTGDQTVFTAAQINERYNYSFSDTVLSDKVWKEVENAGAVFLAPTGTYAAEYGGYILEYQGDYLNLYWSSSPHNMEQASVYGYDGGSLCVGFDGYVPRCFKCAVRLVRLAE